MKTPKKPSTTSSKSASANKPGIKTGSKPKKIFDDEDDDFDEIDEMGFDDLSSMDEDDDY